MTTPLPIALLAAVSIMHTACTGAPTPAGPPSYSMAQTAPAKPADPAAASTSSPRAPTPSASPSLEPFRLPALQYAPRGRRDPFAPIRTGGEAATRRAVLMSARLTGIVRGPGGALALVETLDGTGHILRPGEGFGEGRLLEIGVDFVLFDVSPASELMPTRIVLRLESTPDSFLAPHDRSTGPS
jgi:hypothetical protein